MTYASPVRSSSQQSLQRWVYASGASRPAPATGPGSQLHSPVTAMVLHPEFDPLTKTWFVEDVEAPTIRELITEYYARYPLRGVPKVPGYFPAGRVVSAKERGCDINRSRQIADRQAAVLVQKHKQERLVPKPKGVGRPPGGQFDKNAILNLWQQDLLVRIIAERIGCSESYVENVVFQAREAKDTRALRRGRGFKGFVA